MGSRSLLLTTFNGVTGFTLQPKAASLRMDSAVKMRVTKPRTLSNSTSTSISISWNCRFFSTNVEFLVQK